MHVPSGRLNGALVQQCAAAWLRSRHHSRLHPPLESQLAEECWCLLRVVHGYMRDDHYRSHCFEFEKRAVFTITVTYQTCVSCSKALWLSAIAHKFCLRVSSGQKQGSWVVVTPDCCCIYICTLPSSVNSQKRVDTGRHVLLNITSEINILRGAVEFLLIDWMFTLNAAEPTHGWMIQATDVRDARILFYSKQSRIVTNCIQGSFKKLMPLKSAFY